MNALHKAEALIEALDYFRAFRKKIIVVKLGGSIMDDSDCLNSTLADLVLMETAGMFPVLVHGGGKAIDQAMAKQGLQPKKIAGRRITDDDTLAIVRDVHHGLAAGYLETQSAVAKRGKEILVVPG